MNPPEPTPDPDPLCDADPLARALAKLRPAPAGLDPQKLLFQAGQAARDRTVAFWRRAFLAQVAVLALIGCLGTVQFIRMAEIEDRLTNPQVVERVVYVDRQPSQVPGPGEQVPEPAPPPRPAEESLPPGYQSTGPFARQGPDPDDLARYLRTRREVLTAGLGVLPDARPRPAAPVNPADLEKSLDLPPGVLAVPQWQPPKPPRLGPENPQDAPE